MNSFLCTYCGQHQMASARSLEHILPAAVGGAFTTRDVCHTCNQMAGRDVDSPWMRDVFIVAERHRHQVRDRHGKVPAAPRVRGRLRDTGDGVFVTMHRDGWQTEPIARTTSNDDGSITITASASDYVEVSRKTTERLARRHPGFRFDVSGEPRRSSLAERWVTIDYSTRMEIWPRFAAKIGLAFGREMLGEAWAVTAAADRLRSTLHGNDDINLGYYIDLWGSALEDGMRHLFPAPIHAAWVVEHNGALHLMVVLFGSRSISVPLGVGALDDGPLWWCDPTKRHSERSTWAGYVQKVAERIAFSPELTAAFLSVRAD